ncbi:AAA family ATPase, partial [bacterium]|nr:AAA family ATPase [bacterium]
MNSFFNSNKDSNSIIAKEDVLLPDYVPTEALHRTSEMKEIAAAINPMINGKKCNNLFIYGTSGTGKTTCMKILIEQLNENTSKVIPVYANCWEYSTKMAIYYKICEALRIILPRRGLASDEVFERILEVMKKENRAVLVVLDELDSLVFNKEESVLYVLSRANEKDGANFGIIGISNKKDLTRLLDSRIASSLRFSSLEFKEYTEEQLKEILLERAKAALLPCT